MSLRIACDLDGTVADMERALQQEAERLFGSGVRLRPSARSEEVEPRMDERGAGVAPSGESERERPSPARPLSAREIRTLWSHVRKITNFWTTLAEIEDGSVRRLAELTAQHRWHVVFLTRRPQTRGESAQRQSQRWLDERGFPLPSVCIVSHSRGVLAGALDLNAVIDDRPETCLDVAADSKAEPILVWRAGAAALPPGVTGLGVTAVPTFHAALDRLEEITNATRRPGFVDRVKAALRSS